MAKQPLDLGAGKVRIQNETGSASGFAKLPGFAELCTAGGSPTVLPDDRTRHRASHAALPNDRGFALIRDADRGGRRALDPGALDELPDRVQGASPDLLGIVLDPARLGEVLGELGVALATHLALGVDPESRSSSRALVDCQNE